MIRSSCGYEKLSVQAGRIQFDEFNERFFDASIVTIKQLIDTIWLKEEGYNESTLLWITKVSFLRLLVPSVVRRDQFLGKYNHPVFDLIFRCPGTSPSSVGFSVHSTSIEDALICLNTLLELEDSHFTEVIISCPLKLARNTSCPFHRRQIENLLRIKDRRVTLSRMLINEPQCRLLFSSRESILLGFDCCQFEDSGLALVDYARRGMFHQSNMDLFFSGCIPFSEIHWISFLDMIKTTARNTKLSLSCVSLGRKSCNELSKFKELQLQSCYMKDGGRKIALSVAHGLGPRSLSLSDGQHFSSLSVSNPCDSVHLCQQIIAALPTERCSLENLSLTGTFVHRFDLQYFLCKAVHANQSLVCLSLCNFELSNDLWLLLLQAVASHRRLQKLEFKDIRISDHDKSGQDERTECLVKVLAVNYTLEFVSFDPDMFDSFAWKQSILPRLTRNKYRRFFAKLHGTEKDEARAALVGASLARVLTNPSLTYLLLSMSIDTLSVFSASTEMYESPDSHANVRKHKLSVSSECEDARKFTKKARTWPC